VGWQIAMKARMECIPQVTDESGFHSLDHWHFLTMWLISSAPGDPEDDTVMETHGIDASQSTEKSLMHAIWTEDYEAEHVIV